MKQILAYHVDASLVGARPGQGPVVQHLSDFDLFDGLTVKLDAKAGGQASIMAARPLVGRPFFRITHHSGDTARWMALSCALDLSDLVRADRLVVSLFAAAPETVSVFALLRLYSADGSWSDTSSAQIELRRQPRTHVCPISLDDLPPGALSRANRACLMILVESRDVAIDLSGLEVVAVPSDPVTPSEAILDHLRSAPDVHRVALQVVPPKPLSTHHISLGGTFFVDSDPKSAAAVLTAGPAGALTVAFPESLESSWQSIEFRFGGIADSSGLTALFRIDAQAEYDRQPQATVVVRRYLPDGTWSDSGPAATLALTAQRETGTALVYLYAMLGDARPTHDFGVMLFLPRGCTALSLFDAEVFVYDRLGVA